MLNLSPEGAQEFIRNSSRCSDLWKKVNNKVALTAEEQTFLDQHCASDTEDYYETIGNGCSWYCGGNVRNVTASSSLTANKGITYEAINAHDFSYRTAWVEGVPGYGIGQYLEYTFPPESPRITTVIIANGYVKSPQAWNDNARVKTLNMYLNNQLLAVLHLADTRQEQIFTFDPMGNSNRQDLERLKSGLSWTLRFEIAEVYPGSRYEDTVISELYFDGIDVH